MTPRSSTAKNVATADLINLVDVAGCISIAVYSHYMNLKTAALLALVGMILLTIVLAVDFINTFLGVMRDLVPALALVRSFIYLIASLGMLAFLYVFHRTQA